MANKKKTFGLVSAFIGTIGLIVYALRRQVISRLLKLHAPRYSVLVRRKIPMPMHNGVILYADHFIPKGKGLFPTILIRTPYGRGGPVGPTGILHDIVAQRFAERGYNVLVQDVRGTFDSQGEFVPFADEPTDGKATIEWIQDQSWFNGILGMWGPSYLGYVQWAIAGNAPLYLKAIVPVITASKLPLSGNRDKAVTIDTILRWVVQLDSMDRKRYFSNWFGLRRMRPKALDKDIWNATMELPLEDVDLRIVGKRVPFLQEWMQHFSPDDVYWKAFDHSKELSRVTASTHMISGWYDIFLRETLEDYETMFQSNAQTPYLTIGPWSHLDAEGLTESLREGLDWFDVHLKRDRRKLRQKPVRIYVMGGVGWREMDSYPPKAKIVRYYLLGDDGVSREGNGDLSLESPSIASSIHEYTYDPADPTPALGGAMLSFEAGRVDNRKLEARPDVITFTSSILEEEVEIIGPVRLKLFVRSSLDYTDFFGRLCDVYPDGRSINLCDGLYRITPGAGDIQQDGSLLVEIDMWSTANRFQAGHRIRLLIASGAHPRWFRNLGTDEPLPQALKMRSAEQTIFHDREHPSNLILPVIIS